MNRKRERERVREREEREIVASSEGRLCFFLVLGAVREDYQAPNGPEYEPRTARRDDTEARDGTRGRPREVIYKDINVVSCTTTTTTTTVAPSDFFLSPSPSLSLSLTPRVRPRTVYIYIYALSFPFLRSNCAPPVPRCFSFSHHGVSQSDPRQQPPPPLPPPYPPLYYYFHQYMAIIRMRSE